MRQVLYHPEAIMLGIRPDNALAPIMDAGSTATQMVAGRDGVKTSGPGPWGPHMTLCYSTDQQPAEPLIKALGIQLPECEVTIDALTLVVQWGPEGQWNWEPVGKARLTAPS